MGCSGKYMMPNTYQNVQGLRINILSLLPCVHNGVKMKNKRMVVMLIESTIMSNLYS